MLPFLPSFSVDVLLESVPAQILPPIPIFQDIYSHYFTTRYIGIGFLALLYYDHILTLRDEIDLVWRAAPTIAKYALLVYRYGTLTSVTLIVYSLSGSGVGLTTAVCKRLFPSLSVLAVTLNAFADVIAVLHIVVLWRKDRKAMIVLLSGFCITTLVAVVCMCVAMVQLVKTITFSPLLHICVTSDKPLLMAASWISGLFFDIVTITLIYCDARRNRIPFLRSTGITYFLCAIILRLFNLLITTAAPVSDFGLIANIGWPCFSINLSRFIFRLRSRRKALAQLDSSSPMALGEYQMADDNDIDTFSGPKHLNEMEMSPSSKSLDTSESHLKYSE